MRRRSARQGRAAHAAGSLDKALACHDRAIELDPMLAVAHAGRRDVLAARGRTEEALDSYRQALRIGPARAAALSAKKRAPAQADGDGGDSASG